MAAAAQYVDMEHACFIYRKDVKTGAVHYRHTSSKGWTSIHPASLALPMKVVEGLASKVKEFQESVSKTGRVTAVA